MNLLLANGFCDQNCEEGLRFIIEVFGGIEGKVDLDKEHTDWNLGKSKKTKGATLPRDFLSVSRFRVLELALYSF